MYPKADISAICGIYASDVLPLSIQGSAMNSSSTLMSYAELARLPCGIDDFADLRARNMIYADKTAIIYNMAVQYGRIFITRPRRFGKTLLVSTFESLFKNGLKYFKGLAIEKLWQDPNTYPVIRLDFSSCKASTLDDFKERFAGMVATALKKAGLPLPPKTEDIYLLQDRIQALFDSFNGINPVLLIDEYDAPLNVCLNDPELFDQIRNELVPFYSTIKKIGSKLRFLFITGICKYKNLSIFSDVNFVRDVSFDTDMGTLLGYTDEEILNNFGPFIDNASHVLGISYDECKAKLKQHYDGFCFDRKAITHVYTPWSVLSFLNSPQEGFLNYWYESAGQAAILLNYIAGHTLQKPSDYGRDQLLRLDKLDTSRDLNNLADVALLYQTGYLAIKHIKSDEKLATLNYPNAEVAESMALLYSDVVYKNNHPSAVIGMSARSLFASVEVHKIPEKLNQVFLCNDYLLFPIVDEASLRSHLLMYVNGSGIEASVENHNALGRSDLEFIAGKRAFVFELKTVKEDLDDEKLEQKAQQLLSEAIAQIKEKRYGEQHITDKKLIRMALVFSVTKRQIIAFDVVE